MSNIDPTAFKSYCVKIRDESIKNVKLRLPGFNVNLWIQTCTCHWALEQIQNTGSVFWFKLI